MDRQTIHFYKMVKRMCVKCNRAVLAEEGCYTDNCGMKKRVWECVKCRSLSYDEKKK